MKQVQQSLKNGSTRLVEVPDPQVPANGLLIQTRASLISAGTERMLVEFGRASLIGKARSQPEKVRQALDKLRSEGVVSTVEAVLNRLDEPLPLGYCNAGVVLAAGPGVTGFAPGDRVANNGPHAGLVAVPAILCAKIPEGVSDGQAAFTVLASVGLQGIRLLQPTLGERIVVYGLGLIGLLSVQLLRAHGCEVLGIDLDPRRLALAESFGARTLNAAGGADPAVAAEGWTGGLGVDGVLITASTKDDSIIHQSALMCRKRGRIVLVGVVGLSLQRADFYEKELTFQVSCSYGPGRYDPAYEQAGHDYPPGFVRWTEQRNFQAVLQSIASGRLAVDGLISHRFPFERAADAYRTLEGDPEALGILLEYPETKPVRLPFVSTGSVLTNRKTASVEPVIAVIGAGNFSKMTLMPALARAGARIAWVCDLNGAAAAHLAKKHGAERSTTDYRSLLDDPRTTAVIIAVQHNQHARMAGEALEAGKHVFVEKPLAMNEIELTGLLEAVGRHQEQNLMVGFNRRFSPHTRRLRELIAGRCEPLALSMTVNAGAIPPGHWVHDPARGGGRIVGEACHFIDLMVCLCGAQVVSIGAAGIGEGPAVRGDKLAMSLSFADGSIGTLNYFANGHRSYPKERLELFCDGNVFVLDNFRQLHVYGRGSGLRTLRQEKGHAAELAAFTEHLATGGAALIPLPELVNVTLATFAAERSARERRTIVLAEEYPGFAGN